MVVKYFVAVSTGDKTGYVVDVEVRENVYMSAVEEMRKDGECGGSGSGDIVKMVMVVKVAAAVVMMIR